jgi:hypothetical protein
MGVAAVGTGRQARWELRRAPVGGYGRVALLVFCLIQVLDGGLTYVGLRHLGIESEANPVVAWYAITLGPGAGLIAVKSLAIACGAILYLAARPFVIGALNLVYVGAAILPWLTVLWP